MKVSILLVSAHLALSSLAFAESPYPWKAAATKAVITPDKPLWMAGYAGRKGPSDGVLQDIHAKCLAIEDAEGSRFVFVTLDLIGVPRQLRDDIERHCIENHDLPPECLLINASHTHSGPMIRTYFASTPEGRIERAPYLNIPEEEQSRRVAEVREYRSRLVATISSLVDDSLANLSPSHLAYSHAYAGFALNRRTRTPDGDFRNFPNPDGPVVHTVPVLQVRAADDTEKLIAVLFGYNCHSTTLGFQQINGDWPGFAQTYFEADHPGTLCLFLNGASGDQNPYPRRQVKYAEYHGRTMATAIEATLETNTKPLSGPLGAALDWTPVKYLPAPSRKELIERSSDPNRYEAHYAKFLLAELNHFGKFPESYPVPVQVVRFGDSLVLAAMGGEVVIDYAIRLGKELGENESGAPVWFAGYSNDVMTYIPSRRVLEEGGYEGKTSIRYVRSAVHPNNWDPSIEETLVSKVHELNERLGSKP